jgi:DNA-directed RNA polymerase specialized sigma24 family protein
MIALPKPVRRRKRVPNWQQPFLEMLPAIKNYARRAFRDRDPEAREDAVQEVLANAAVAFARLAELDKIDLAYPQVLARYAIAQYHDGRRVGSRLRIGDVMSPYAKRKKGFRVESLDRFDKESGEWLEAVVEDTHTPVPEQVAFRIDFPTWLQSQTKRNRRIATALALGHGTGEVARRFNVSAGRVSQLRREFCQSWKEFHDEPALAAA